MPQYAVCTIFILEMRPDRGRLECASETNSISTEEKSREALQYAVKTNDVNCVYDLIRRVTSSPTGVSDY